MNSHSYRYSSRFFEKEPNKWVTQILLPALGFGATIFFGLEAIESRDSSPQVESGQTTSQMCESFYKEMNALNEAGLSIEGLAQIEDSREDVCGPAHTVPYVWEIESPNTNKDTEENQPNEDNPPANTE